MVQHEENKAMASRPPQSITEKAERSSSNVSDVPSLQSTSNSLQSSEGNLPPPPSLPKEDKPGQGTELDGKNLGREPRWKKRNMENHLIGERRRRNLRKEKIDTLAALLPGLDKARHLTKAMVLQEAVTTVKQRLKANKSVERSTVGSGRRFLHMEALLNQSAVGIASVRLGDTVIRNSNYHLVRILLKDMAGVTARSLDNMDFLSLFDPKESLRLLPVFQPRGPKDDLSVQVFNDVECVHVSAKIRLEVVVDSAVGYAIVIVQQGGRGSNKSFAASVSATARPVSIAAGEPRPVGSSGWSPGGGVPSALAVNCGIGVVYVSPVEFQAFLVWQQQQQQLQQEQEQQQQQSQEQQQTSETQGSSSPEGQHQCENTENEESEAEGGPAQAVVKPQAVRANAPVAVELLLSLSRRGNG